MAGSKASPAACVGLVVLLASLACKHLGYLPLPTANDWPTTFTPTMGATVTVAAVLLGIYCPSKSRAYMYTFHSYGLDSHIV